MIMPQSYRREDVARIPRIPSFYIATCNSYINLLTRLIESEEALMSFLRENLEYSTALKIIRSFQWMGLVDASFISNPFRKGLSAVKLNEMPILTILKKSDFQPKEAACISFILSYLLPTPFKKVIETSKRSNSLQELAEKMSVEGNVVERILAYDYLQSKSKDSDLIYLLLLAYASGIVRRGKKSDPGQKLSYPREQFRAEWGKHPCFAISPKFKRIYIAIDEIKQLLYGSEDLERCSTAEDKSIEMENVFLSIKGDLPRIFGFYIKYYNLET